MPDFQFVLKMSRYYNQICSDPENFKLLSKVLGSKGVGTWKSPKSDVSNFLSTFEEHAFASEMLKETLKFPAAPFAPPIANQKLKFPKSEDFKLKQLQQKYLKFPVDIALSRKPYISNK